MKTTLKIAKAELNTLFYSPIAWFLSIVFLIQCGFAYTSTMENLVNQQEMGPIYARWLSYLTSVVFGLPQGLYAMVTTKIFLYIPLLTMGLVSREINSGTIKLLYSSPIKIREIIIGKYLAIMAYNLLLIMILAVFVVSGMLSIHSADKGLLFSGLLGIYLLLCAYSAIGLFMSCLTSYQVVSAISTLVLFAILGYIGTIWQNIDFVRNLTFFLSISGRTDHLLSGLISTKDIFYFFVIVYIFIGLSIIKLQAEREAKSIALLIGKYVLVVISGLFIGYITAIPGFAGYYDATSTLTESLSPNVKNIVKGLKDGPLEVTSYINLFDDNFYDGSPQQRNKDLARWEPYLRFKSDIKINYVYFYDSLYTNKMMYRGYEGKSLKQITTHYLKNYNLDLEHFKSPEEIRKIINLRPENNRYVMQLKYQGRSTFLRLFDDQLKYPREAEIAAALQRLTIKIPKIAFVTGEFERSIDKFTDKDYEKLTNDISFRYALVNQGFDVESLILQEQEIPSDIAVLVIADPRVSFSQEVLNKIQRYINNGGNLLIAGEPGKQAKIDPIIQALGVNFIDGELVQKSKDFAPDLIRPLITKVAAGFSSELKEHYTDSLSVSMPNASALNYSVKSEFHVEPLLLTNEKETWNKKDKFVLDSADVVFSPEKGDEQRKFPTALALTRMVNGKQQRIVIAGDADFLSNAELAVYYGDVDHPISGQIDPGVS
ncbi:Gldg family protein [Mucilaginibacter sp. L196]|uniref:Gldg family protein n=1 Tax=Mucilaginibacter sp. L196 TaxID=1641870 RepID=UPI00131C9DE7|nr:Gldg family protein [Mucilaginibacter sp. L196]